MTNISKETYLPPLHLAVQHPGHFMDVLDSFRISTLKKTYCIHKIWHWSQYSLTMIQFFGPV